MTTKAGSPVRILLFLLAAISAVAQSGPQQVTIPSTGFAGLDKYRASRIAVYTDDFGQLARYRDANAALKPSAAGESRVVFFGDSITDNWPIAESFPGKPYINRGIGGQTTSQMLVRFRQDVIDLAPKVVVILAGTNDIAGNSGPISNENIEANLASLAELARAHGIRVVFSSVLPVHNYTPKSQDFYAQRPMARILALNEWLKGFCSGSGATFLDYFSALVDDKGLLKLDLADDGLHPNKAGYAIMAPLAEQAIEKALPNNSASNNGSISIQLAHNSDRKLQTQKQLEHLIASYDLGKYTFTRVVIIDEGSIPHSHPILTLHTRHLNSDDQLLSTYVHVQLHWFLEQHESRTQAEDDLRKTYAKVPVGFPDGSDTEEGTYLHLITCYLEMLADRDLMGSDRAAAVMSFWAQDHYRWIYQTVIQDEATIRKVVVQEHLQVT